MKSIYVPILAAICFLSSCNDSAKTTVYKDFVPINLTTSQTQQVLADNSFAFDLMHNVNASDTSSNIFISPLSVSMALAMTYNGAAGDTKIAMETALRRTGFTVEEINSYFKKMSDALTSIDPTTQLKIANSIWTLKDFPVLQSFYNTNKSYYNAEIQSLDFSQSSSKDIINNWCSQNTDGKIPSIINQIPDNVIMYLINALYFKGIWKYQFQKSATTDNTFYAPEGNKTIQFMNQKATFNYFMSDSIQCAELPYGNTAFSMVIILPASRYTPNDILSKLTPSVWANWMNRLNPTTLEVALPKFSTTYEINLNSVLANMGMGIAFTDFADFTGISSGSGLCITEVKHKTYIAVDEDGTEAAAVTAVSLGTTAALPFNIVINRPFLFVIKEKSTGAILFIGKISSPQT